MKIIEKINTLNKYVSFNLFAFDGYIILVSTIYFMHFYNTNFKLYGNGSWQAASSWLIIDLLSIILIPLIIALIFRLIEMISAIEIKNKFFLENRFISILRNTGTFVTILFLLFFISIFILSI